MGMLNNELQMSRSVMGGKGNVFNVIADRAKKHNGTHSKKIPFKKNEDNKLNSSNVFNQIPVMNKHKSNK